MWSDRGRTRGSPTPLRQGQDARPRERPGVRAGSRRAPAGIASRAVESIEKGRGQTQDGGGRGLGWLGAWIAKGGGPYPPPPAPKPSPSPPPPLEHPDLRRPQSVSRQLPSANRSTPSTGNQSRGHKYQSPVKIEGS